MPTHTTAKVVNIRGKKMVELFVTDMYLGSSTNVIPYVEAKEAYDNHEALFDWTAGFTRSVIHGLFEDTK